MEQQVNLDDGKYGLLIRTFSVLKDVCNDVVINKGFIRQRTNDSAAIFEIDLTSILNESSLTVSNIKEKIDLLKIFSQQGVQIHINDISFTFSDNLTSLNFVQPDKNYLDNKFMEEVELSSLISLDEEQVLTTHSITPVISERMKIISASYHVNSFQMVYEGETASIKSRTMSKDQHANIVGNLLLNEPITGYSNLVTTPYICDHDGDILCKIYKQRDKCICKYSMFIGSIPATIYTRCEIREDAK